METMPGKMVGGWEQLELLGEGGQSKVYLVRSPGRVQGRADMVQPILAAHPWQIGLENKEREARIRQLAVSLWNYARPDEPSELGALKMLKLPDHGPDADQAHGRFRHEVALLRQGRQGLIKLLDSNETEGWLVTEYMPNGTLMQHPDSFKGRVYDALKVFRPLVEAVASLHKDRVVHRDIKPANVFLSADNGLVLGDPGIIFIPDPTARLTVTQERVGSRDYMPPWADRGERLENVEPDFDVYMLGKLLWCMLTGRLKLPREDHNLPAYDVTVLFPNDPKMRLIKDILGKCVVVDAQHCIRSADLLLPLIDQHLAEIEKGLPTLDGDGKMALPCRVCGKGFYREQSAGATGAHGMLPMHDSMSRQMSATRLRIFVCSVCCHYEFFAPNFPDEAAKKGWKPW